MAERLVGTVTHYYDRLGVAIVDLDANLRVGDAIHVVGKKTDFQQMVESMQVEHQPVQEAGAGQHIGLKVISPAREKDQVYKVE